MNQTQPLVLDLERATAAALPALQTRYYDGWVLRLSQGYTRRGNCVAPLYGSEEDVAIKIGTCENIFRQAEIDPAFKITPLAQPTSLDAILEDRGYDLSATVSVQVCDLERFYPDHAMAVQWTSHLTTTWLDALSRLRSLPTHQNRAAEQMLRAIRLPTCFTSLGDGNNRIVAIGLGVYDAPLLGIYSLYVDESQRRKGLGTKITHDLMAWGKTQGATQAYLQVDDANLVAKRLYDRLGFSETYKYYYRIKPHART